MRGALLVLGISIGAAVSACDETGASVEITDARAFRAAGGRVVVDVDLRAHESLGKNIGVYCTRVTFAGEVDPVEACSADLEDGDTKTVRLMSAGDPAPGAAITIRVRLDRVDVGRSLAAPPR